MNNPIWDNGVIREMTLEEVEEMEQAKIQEPPPTQEQQAVTLMRAMARTATNIPDAVALSIPDILPTWQEFLDAGEQIGANVCLMHERQCYRTKQSVTPQAHQPPGSEGMLAIYSPIDQKHAGTIEDPIPWVYGMDCEANKYYSYNGHVYRAKMLMQPCVWAPGDPGTVNQWEQVS